MDRLVPFERLQDDYYVGDTIRDGGGHAYSDDGDSSDDEVQTALKQIAGYGPDQNCMGEKTRGKTEFEQEMDDELNDRMSDYVRSTMRDEAAKVGNGDINKGDDTVNEDIDMPPLEDQPEREDGSEMVTSPMKSSLRIRTSSDTKRDDVEMEGIDGETDKKKVKFADSEINAKIQGTPDDGKVEEKEPEEYDDESSNEDEDEEEGNPIKTAARAIRKEAKEAREKEQSSTALPDFYNPSEDDDNEEWVQERRRSSQGRMDDGRKVNPKQIRLEDGSDAVLSCPGCMVLLTRDCQRHEIYKEQYRAMFVENCLVDEDEQLTVEKSGKEKRRERQKMRKEGGSDSAGNLSDGNSFKAVRCTICTTKVAVIDHDEVYHFFNMSDAYPTLPSAPPVDEPPPPSYDTAMNSDGLPPSYDELYGQFQSVDSPSAFAKFIGFAFEALSRTVAATVIFALLNIVPIGMIIIGGMNENNCAAQPMIPKWLVVLGSLYLIRAAVSAYVKWKQSQMHTLYRPHIFIRLINLLLAISLFVWFILGSIWVLSVSPDDSKGCDHFMYTFAYVFIILSYTVLALSCFACCCCCCFICCRQPRDQRQRLNQPGNFA
ncbi:hypothetical protein PRIPAC_92093 [Pristionchus pacificus]|uniref:Uncharacterized protein n=1 Tax=Pristionchus pacificus TaxID=54126 RepID=A0A2A6CHC6_PRIPA|nr:hypothetical protein PRIPAC_92093 [Pristionchus pacificus]|eukprot:PDM77539.1 hypothetical protein PRIPAC_34406 [Pristionchus pacificus]